MGVRFFVIPVLGEVMDLTYEKPPGRTRGSWLPAAIGEYFDESYEHVAVLYEGRRCDMFVGETSSINGRHIRNVRATAIYRNNMLTRNPHIDPESMHAISGPAVLFPDEIVWK